MPNPPSAMKQPAQNTSPTLQGGIIVGAVEISSAMPTLVIQFLSIKMPITIQRVLKAAPANIAGTVIEVGLSHAPVDPTVKVLKMNPVLLQPQLSIAPEEEQLITFSVNNWKVHPKVFLQVSQETGTGAPSK